jgi:RNA polymerase sigma-70 factor (ECF subfamily)
VRDTTEVESMTPARLAEVERPLARAEAFRRLADSHLDSSYRLARAILGDPAEAQDATHDAFVTAWRKWSTLRDPALFEHWFDRILVHTCRNRLRRTHRWRGRDLSPELLVAPDALGQIHDRDALDPAIARLSADHQIVVVLRFHRDLTLNEIATRLGVRPGTVKSRLHYALKRLHSELDRAADGGHLT